MTFAFLAAAVAASGCSFLVSTDGLSAGDDAGGGGTATGSGAGPSDPGVVLGDAAVSPPGVGAGDAALPEPGSGDASGSGGPSGKLDGGVLGPGPDAAGGTDSGAGVDAPPTSCSLGNTRVFVTSAMYDGNLGGVSGADTDCTTRATAAGLGGSWRAWLSDSVTPALAHVRRSKAGYVLVDGTTVVATSFIALVSGSLAHAIDLTETGAPVTNGQTEVWTGIDLTSSMSNGGFCTDGSGNDWSSNSSGASTPLVGHLDATDATWSAAYLQLCNRTNVRLYCFESCP